MARFGLLLMMALFGVLMFASGALAPASLQQTLRSWGVQATSAVARLAPAPAGKASAPAAKASAPAAAPAAGADQKKPDPLPYESLIVPSPPPDKAKFGLQLHQFADAVQAKELRQTVEALKLPADLLDIVDEAGLEWVVVAVGPYATQDEARAARAAVALKLGRFESMPLILWPAPPKPKA